MDLLNYEALVFFIYVSKAIVNYNGALLGLHSKFRLLAHLETIS
jgi:hypothetical protein